MSKQTIDSQKSNDILVNNNQNGRINKNMPIILLTNRQQRRRKFFSNIPAVIGLTIIFILVMLAAFAPVITSYSPEETDLLNMRSSPSKEHILGTDDLGRDIFTRIVYGGRISILVGLASMLLQMTIGVSLGAIAGYFGGWIDQVIMRIVDMIMSFPFFAIAIALASVMGKGIANLIFIIGILMWPGIARLIRAEVLIAKESDYVKAAQAMGLGSREILINQIFPNILSPVFIASTLSVASGILMESTLSFLNLGVSPPTPSWGNMLVSAQNMAVLKDNWWMWIPPGLAVILMVLSINYVGEGLRDAYDVRR